MKRKTHKLQTRRNHDFSLIAISSHENDYRLSWSLNRSLSISFIKSDNLIILNSRINAEQEFSLSRYYDEDKLLDYRLISNRCDDGFLLEEMTNIDFLLHITGECQVNFLEQQLKAIKEVDIVTAAFLLEPESLKSVYKLIF